MAALVPEQHVRILGAISGQPCMSTLRLPSSAKVKEVKRSVQVELGINAFQQRLLLAATSAPPRDDEVLASLSRKRHGVELVEPLEMYLLKLAHTDPQDTDPGFRLLEAVQSETADVVEELLKVPTWPDYTDVCGRTPLWLASFHGRLQVAQLLIEAGADLERATDDGETPLLAAAQTGRSDVVRLLMQAGAEKDTARQDGMTALFIASVHGHTEVVRFLCEAGAELDKVREDGMTALLIACVHGHAEAAKLLVEAGADLNKARLDGSTPLIAAAQSEHLEIVRLLVEAGADPSKATLSGETAWYIALHRACLTGRLGVLRLLAKAAAGGDRLSWDFEASLRYALEHGQEEVARMLCESWDRFQSTRADNESALCIAARLGLLEVVKQLCVTGVDLDRARHDGATPLIVATAHEHHDVVQALVEAGADLARATLQGETALTIACGRASGIGGLKLMRLLIEAHSKEALRPWTGFCRKFLGTMASVEPNWMAEQDVGAF